MKDPDIRTLLRETELRKFVEDSNSKVVHELRLSPATAQIDIAVINGAFHAYEIKSASDNLSRLAAQIKSYSKIFDYITVVSEEKHVFKILDIVPRWVGVVVCHPTGLSHRRKAKRNKNVDGFYIAQLLWRDEMQSILIEKQIDFKQHYRNWILSELLAENISVKKLSESVREKLKARPNWKEEN